MVDAEQARLTRIAARLRQIEQEGKMPAYDVLVKQVDAVFVATCREIVPLAGGFGQPYGKIATYLDQQHVQPGSPILFLLHSRSEQRDDGLYIDVEAAIPYTGVTVETLARIARVLDVSISDLTEYEND